jgi:tRNA-binding protein
VDAIEAFEKLVGQKTSAAQLTARYRPDQLVDRRVAVVNLGERSVAGFTSEVLVLGVPDPSGETVLLAVEPDVPPGGRVY